MDHQRDTDWIEPLEATTLSADEEAKTQTPVSAEGDMNWAGPRFDCLFGIRRRIRGRTIRGVRGGCRKTPPSSDSKFSMPRSGREMEPFPSAKTATEPCVN